MSIEGQGHFFTIYFPGFVCFVLYLAKISGERLQDHWSSGFIMRTERLFLGNETSVNMFDHLFFLHSSFVSPSSPSEGLRNRVYFKRKEH